MMKSPTLPVLEDSLYDRLNFPSILVYNLFAARLMNTLTNRALYICLYFVSILLLLSLISLSSSSIMLRLFHYPWQHCSLSVLLVILSIGQFIRVSSTSLSIPHSASLILSLQRHRRPYNYLRDCHADALVAVPTRIFRVDLTQSIVGHGYAVAFTLFASVTWARAIGHNL